jgi:hypothetical protein
MHQQVKTSPEESVANLRAVLDVLANAQPPINVEGIGSDFDCPHIRTVVAEAEMGTAFDALASAGLEPELRAAVTVSVSDAPGALREVIRRLIEDEGRVMESLLLLVGGGAGNTVRVSIGVEGELTEQDSIDMAARLADGLAA